MDFRLHKSIRYHEKLRAFYDFLHNTAVVATAVSSTSAFFLLVASEPYIATYLTALVGLASVLDWVLQFEKKARLHDGLRGRLTDLAADAALKDVTEPTLRFVRSELFRIEGDDPGLRRLVELQARNEELRSRGCREEDMVPLSRAQRILGYGFTFDMRRLELWKADRETAERCDPFPAEDTEAVPSV